MIEAIINGVTAGAIGVFGVLIGGILTYRLGLKAEKSLIRTKIRIEKIQQTQHSLLEAARDFGKLHLKLSEYEYEKIDHKSYCEISDETQDRFTKTIRSIRVNEVIIKDYGEQIEQLFDDYSVLCNMQYDRYYNPNNNKRRYSDEELTFEIIDSKFQAFIMSVIRIQKSLDLEIEKELK
ncbi:hypothetical protein [Paenibacillus sp. IHBB 10380]|uniref:hypothetical protein n=1 Tax=Paenibacillus sp. IHBB 10380 TaxID=1566358 RepID=UPI0011855414|nr:hypothetical protein [Paenibacillus sp. IHBB 10380]